MNILYLCDEYPPGKHGGIGTAVQLLARQMSAMGHNVIVAGFYDWGYGERDYFVDEGVKVYRFRRRLAHPMLGNYKSLPVKAINKLLKISGILEWDVKSSINRYGVFLNELIKMHKIDIVEMPDYLDYVRFSKSYVPFPKLTIPSVVKLHGSFTYFAKESGQEVPAHITKMDQDLLRAATKVCSVSNYTAKKTKDYLEYKGNIKVIHNGIDTNIRLQNVEKQRGKVVFSGTLIQKKGIYELLKAWNIVQSEADGAELWVYGKGPVKNLQKVLRPAALESVKFMGHVSRNELLRSLSDANAAVFPSFAETFGLAPIEAMACGTAVIFTTRTSGPEIVEHNVDGLLVDPANVEQIAESICYLLQNPDICSRLATKGFKKVRTEFDIVHIASLHIEYYKSILN